MRDARRLNRRHCLSVMASCTVAACGGRSSESAPTLLANRYRLELVMPPEDREAVLPTAITASGRIVGYAAESEFATLAYPIEVTAAGLRALMPPLSRADTSFAWAWSEATSVAVGESLRHRAAY
jgi:hypothetical protein